MTPPDLPHDSEAERAVIGGVLVDPSQLDIASAIVTPEDFYSLHHRYLWMAILELAEDRQPIDSITVRVRLEQHGHLDEVKAAYLYSLTDGVPRAMNVPAYAARVRELAERRRIILTARKLEAQASDQGVPILELSDAAQRAVLDLTARQSVRGFVSIADVLREQTWPALTKARATLGQHRGITGLATGFADLDARTGGLQPGWTYILGARTTMGKTALAGDIAVHASVTLGVPVAVFTPEMSAHDLTVRTLAKLGRANMKDLLGGCSTEAEWQRVSATMLALTTRVPGRLFFDDSTPLRLAELRARLRRVHSEHGPLRLVIVDYIQLVHETALRAETRNLELGGISIALGALAKELQVPVVILSQLNRASETREGGKPKMSDLRESGSLEQDADAVWLLHRPADNSTLADVIIAKNRHGQTGEVKLRWIPEQTRFTNEYDTDEPEPPAPTLFAA